MSTQGVNKDRLVAALREKLTEELAILRAAAAAAREGATHEDAKAENEYDTRALEQSYLAGAQTARADALAAALGSLEGFRPLPLEAGAPASLGACVVVDDGETERRYFLCEVGGGTRLEVDGVSWVVLTPGSPLGQSLLGRQVGDFAEHITRKETCTLEIVSLC